ncbi:hypothetical protein M413DRAFT_121497 [Hebeloma cylindrosporum]|uniref:Uncharacterized protein n=1 Tax=Hebeloma cylindrosporum TaxID=76867 RepID=A0A0C2YNT2_HEBCY|nr:hypothetical protein M413DRAFT_121497 [Hebeloma cylindrosporum h7]
MDSKSKGRRQRQQRLITTGIQTRRPDYISKIMNHGGWQLPRLAKGTTSSMLRNRYAVVLILTLFGTVKRIVEMREARNLFELAGYILAGSRERPGSSQVEFAKAPGDS